MHGEVVEQVFLRERRQLQGELLGGGQPDDQRPDDVLSLVYDWEPLTTELDVMGYPRLRLTVTSPTPVARSSSRRTTNG